MDVENMKKMISKAFDADKVSLCHACCCMTHTIDGKCGKCKAIKLKYAKLFTFARELDKMERRSNACNKKVEGR